MNFENQDEVGAVSAFTAAIEAAKTQNRQGGKTWEIGKETEITSLEPQIQYFFRPINGLPENGDINEYNRMVRAKIDKMAAGDVDNYLADEGIQVTAWMSLPNTAGYVLSVSRLCGSVDDNLKTFLKQGFTTCEFSSIDDAIEKLTTEQNKDGNKKKSLHIAKINEVSTKFGKRPIFAYRFA